MRPGERDEGRRGQDAVPGAGSAAAEPEGWSWDAPGPPLLLPGTPVVFVDPKHRVTYAVLEPGGVTEARGHRIEHDRVIGRPDGCQVLSDRGRLHDAFVASLADHCLNMERHANIVYPKDWGPLLVGLDLRPGDHVVEGGLGSGALSIVLLRAIGPTGRLVTYELHADAVRRARRNIRRFLGETPHHRVRVADIYTGIEERRVDRIVLDVPEPWQVLPHAKQALRPGGTLAAYVPTALQLHRAVNQLYRVGGFTRIEALEVLQRPWHVRENSVRPEQRMVAHTGFLVFARRSSPRPPDLQSA